MGIPEDMLRNLYENMMDAFAGVDMDGRIMTCNDLFCAMVGYSREELISMTYQDLTPEKWHPFEADILREQVLSRGYSDIYQKEYRHKNGAVIPVELRVCLHRDRGGAPDCMWAIVRDISERRRVEEERLEVERRLQHVRKMESIGVLVGGIAHDFNNLLSVILGNLDLALMDLPAASPIRDRIVQAGEVGERAAHLIRQMLAYAGKGLLLTEATDLNHTIYQNEELLRAAATGNTVLAFRPAATLPPVQADREQILQVIVNLISNASEAMDGKPGIINLRTGTTDCDQGMLERSRIEEKPKPGRFVYLEVTDDGCGMDEETQQRLFEPFFTTKFLGRGLGMSAVLGTVRAHHGAILMNSAPGEGTTVRVLLPVLTPTSPPRDAGGKGGAEGFKGRS